MPTLSFALPNLFVDSRRRLIMDVFSSSFTTALINLSLVGGDCSINFKT